MTAQETSNVPEPGPQPGTAGRSATRGRREVLAGGAKVAAATAALGVAGAFEQAAAAPAPGRKRPNILILMTDQERHQDRLPEDLPTPARCWLDENGTRIDNFHISACACTPSRGAFWTGMYAPQTGMFGTFIVGTQFTMDPSIPTIGDLFKEVGYRTAFFGKWHLSYPGEIPTNPEALLDIAQGNPLKGYGFDHSMISPPADVGGYNDGYTNDPIWTGQAVSWLREHANDEQPWMCVLSLLNPHDIQFYPRGFRADFKRPDYGKAAEPELSFNDAESRFDDKPSVHKRFRNIVAIIAGTPDSTWGEPEYWRLHRNTYYDLIVGTDEMLGAAIKTLNEAGALDDTVIVRTADHGELASAHQLQNKGTTIYDEQNRVPFTVVYPKRFPRGRRSQALGEAVDLVPTLLEIAGERKPLKRWPWLRGTSLVKALEDPDAAGPRDSILYRIDEYPVTNVGTAAPTRSHIRQIYDGRFKFARYVAVAEQMFAGTELTDEQELEMYDTWNDPYELRNLANDKGYGGLASDMLAWLYEREKAKYGPVEVPAYGSEPIIKRYAIEVPTTGISGREPPNPWVDVGPGAYVVVPLETPNPARFLYEGAFPQNLVPRSNSAAAADMARYFCELMPGAA